MIQLLTLFVVSDHCSLIMKEHPCFFWLKRVFCLQDVFADLYTITTLDNTLPCQCRRINDNSMLILNWCLFYEIINI